MLKTAGNLFLGFEHRQLRVSTYTETFQLLTKHRFEECLGAVAVERIRIKNGNGSAAKESPLVLSFSSGATSDELRQVQTVLASSPGSQPVRLMFCRADGGFVQMDANLRINLTPELRDKLSPWLGGSSTPSLDV